LSVKLTWAFEEKCEHNSPFLLNNLIHYYVTKVIHGIQCNSFEINKTRNNVTLITPAPLAKR
ncbi:hypothetical protein, partial [Enterobacter cloacae complex sp. S4]|uniref:hypothetical protein n=1 Tax=Enterobacter cloacae complex sp. S4 TaxID=2779536 RepID=UPI001D04D9A5